MEYSGSRLAVSTAVHAAAVLLAASLRVSPPAPSPPAREHVLLVAPMKWTAPAPKPARTKPAAVPAPSKPATQARTFSPPVSRPAPSAPALSHGFTAPIRADLPSAPVQIRPVEPQTTASVALPPPAIVVGKWTAASGSAPSAPATTPLHAGGFQSSTVAPPPPSDRSLATSGFGNASVTSPTAPRKTLASTAPTGVEILYKPRPVYTQEGRRERIEGEVLLEVLFTATGEIRVQRVVQGLGYGLDEAAAHSARNIQFRPATRGGEPVDQAAILHIRFQLAY